MQYGKCARCGTMVSFKNVNRHINQPPCEALRVVAERRNAGWEVVRWGKTQLRAAGIPLEEDIVDYKMLAGQATSYVVHGVWAPVWALNIFSWVARIATIESYKKDPSIHLRDAAKTARIGDASTYNRFPTQTGKNGWNCSRERKFIVSLLKELMALPEDERTVRLTEMHLLGGDAFKAKYFNRIYPNGP